MKKILLSALMLCMASCATLQTKHPQLTAENVAKNCQVSEKWQMSLMGVYTYVIIHNDCYDHKRLLVIVVEKLEGHKAPIQKLTSQLVLNHFLYFMHEREEYKNKYVWNIQPVKTELEENWTVFYYNLEQTKKNSN